MRKRKKRNHPAYHPSRRPKRKQPEVQEEQKGLGAKAIDKIKNFANSKIRILLVVVAIGGATAAILNKDGCEKKEKNIYMVMKINGVEFKFHISWKEIFNEGRLDKERVKKILQRHLSSLSQFLDIPENLELTLVPTDHGGDVQLFILYDKEKLKNQRVLEIQGIKTDNVVGIKPGLIEEPSMLHEFVHLVRVDKGLFVLHHGFEEGMAEYVEKKVFPLNKDLLKKEKTGTLYDFFDKFPELEQISLEDPTFGIREMMGRSESKLKGVAAFKHEIRRRAWERFLDDSSHPERKDFLRKLQGRQTKENKNIWRIGEVLQVGNEVDPKFSEWFKNEKAFQVAKERRVEKVLWKGEILSFLLFEQRKVQKQDPRDPDVFEIVPIKDKINIYLILKSGKEVMVSFNPRPDSIIQHFSFTQLPKALKLSDDEVVGVKVEIVDSGKIIPLSKI